MKVRAEVNARFSPEHSIHLFLIADAISATKKKKQHRGGLLLKMHRSVQQRNQVECNALLQNYTECTEALNRIYCINQVSVYVYPLISL